MNTSNQSTWIKDLEEELIKPGSKKGNFLNGKTGIYIPKKKGLIEAAESSKIKGRDEINDKYEEYLKKSSWNSLLRGVCPHLPQPTLHFYITTLHD